MIKKYKNVKEMVKDISSSASFQNLLSKEISQRKIAKLLILLRCKNNLTQKQIAQKIGCSQGRISKIESACNDEISIKDLLDYAKAINLVLEIGYRGRSTKVVDLVKYHAFKIKNLLDQLSELGEDDSEIGKAIAKFHIEVARNLDKIVKDSFFKLDFVQKMKRQEKSDLHISVPMEKEHPIKEMSKV